MAPKKNIVNSMKFVEIRESYFNSKGETQSRIVNARPEPGSGYDILTDDVLGSGNLELLQ